ncbi:P-loop containing nucleoside triphosphate hydrolase protein [Agrocybe pediades]|nr:P-loop containing nucleoside triphosphate hydrolase protein [Agrocybe pediades]
MMRNLTSRTRTTPVVQIDTSVHNCHHPSDDDITNIYDTYNRSGSSLQNPHGEELVYDLNVTPRASLDSQFTCTTTTTAKDLKSEDSSYPPAPSRPDSQIHPDSKGEQQLPSNPSQGSSSEYAPSLRHLFSFFPRRHFFLLLFPAFLFSVISGVIAPFMTVVVGQIFGFFSAYPTSSPTPEDKKELLKNVGIGCLELVGLAVGSLSLGSLTSALWIWVGEVNTREVRRVVYEAVGKRDMGWFDSIGSSSEEVEGEEGQTVGAGGFMAKFSRITEDIRSASALSLGNTLSHLTTSIACLILAFIRSYQLTLVILSAVPIIIFVQALSQKFATPLLEVEREETARAATTVERAVANISTVKAFNAQSLSLSSSESSFLRLKHAAFRLNKLWGMTSGMNHFAMMAMFVQGFWFGSKLVREGKVGGGDVMAVFWACLISTSNLQMCLPAWIVVMKGMGAMVAVLEAVNEENESPTPPPPAMQKDVEGKSDKDIESPLSPTTTTFAPHFPRPRALRKISPRKCSGELALHNVTFAYPSRATVPVLKDVSLFLPSNEMTFIVGQSGSGKSTVGSILAGLYKLGGSNAAEHGMVLLDEQDTRYLDEKWMRKHIAGVGQQGAAGVVILEGRSVFENLLLGLADDDPFSLAHSGSSGYSWTMDTAPQPLRKRVEDASRAALLHEFVRDLPMGYDTILGDGSGSGVGMGLSGGQKQRLALARGVLRDPTVLILDEPTSALDPTTRLLVFSAIKHLRHSPISPLNNIYSLRDSAASSSFARRNRTTIVITHDLSQIEKGDFVYVMKDGKVVEKGYRGDLEQVFISKEIEEDDGRGEFRKMVESQMRTGGFLPVVEDLVPSPQNPFEQEAVERETDIAEEYEQEVEVQAQPQSLAAINPLTWGDWMFEVVADLTRAADSTVTPPPPAHPHLLQSNNPFAVPSEKSMASDSMRPPAYKKKRPSSIAIPQSPILEEDPMSPTTPKTPHEARIRKIRSLQFTPNSAATSFTAVDRRSTLGYGSGKLVGPALPKEYMEEEEEEGTEEEERQFDEQKKAVTNSGMAVNASRSRQTRLTVRTRQRVRAATLSGKSASDIAMTEVKVEKPADGQREEGSEQPQDEFARPAFWKLMRAIYPTVPNKPVLFIGLSICVLSGAMTPVFSFILSRLLFEVSIGAKNVHTINFFGGVVLGISLLDGFLMGLKYFVMESIGMAWVTRIRSRAFSRILKQDKAWFDESQHAPERIVQIIVRDGDDARDLLSVVWGQFCVVAAMLSIGLLWAMIQGWQLTLAGFAIAPVFAGAMALQTALVANCEVRNKRAREEVARGFYESILHVRSIRSMGFEGVFRKRYDDSVEKALRTGVKGAMVEGCTYGVASALIYLAEALLFYVGAVLVGRGLYTYLQMVQVLNLVVFSVTIGSQLMAFTQRIAKCVQAAADFNHLLNLPTANTHESRGSLKPSLTNNQWAIHFENVSFAYPSRPTQTVLKNVNLTIRPGECVALVGASGSGKSTIASLVQRLYEPSEGRITLGDEKATSLDSVDVKWLRSHVGVVSQHPDLFDASVKENIRYGALAAPPPYSEFDEPIITDDQVVAASRAALLHDFVLSLPQGYDTYLGENAALISGGQAQRLMIARALARKEGKLLVLDECTSALDNENQANVVETIRGLRDDDQGRRTTVMITHKLEVMQMCDRIVVLQDGKIVEQGTYEELMSASDNEGVFKNLARAGEWEG